MCEVVDRHTVRGGGVAGETGVPASPISGVDQGAIGGITTGSTRARASPGTAVHGVAHADSEGFFSAAFPASPSQPAIADAIGVACAAASQNGPNRPRSSTASIASAAIRIIPPIGRARFTMLAIRPFPDGKSTPRLNARRRARPGPQSSRAPSPPSSRFRSAK